MSKHTITIKEAEGHLAELIDRVQKGEEVVICQKDQPSIKLVICEPSQRKRIAGLNKGTIQMSDDFDDSLDDSYWSGQL
tara:strand:- start:1661 stop:1897 length:237 start_codon:yes stop_codon:yes gene_type:complete